MPDRDALTNARRREQDAADAISRLQFAAHQASRHAIGLVETEAGAGATPPIVLDVRPSDPETGDPLTEGDAVGAVVPVIFLATVPPAGAEVRYSLVRGGHWVAERGATPTDDGTCPEHTNLVCIHVADAKAAALVECDELVTYPHEGTEADPRPGFFLPGITVALERLVFATPEAPYTGTGTYDPASGGYWVPHETAITGGDAVDRGRACFTLGRRVPDPTEAPEVDMLGGGTTGAASSLRGSYVAAYSWIEKDGLDADAIFVRRSETGLSPASTRFWIGVPDPADVAVTVDPDGGGAAGGGLSAGTYMVLFSYAAPGGGETGVGPPGGAGTFTMAAGNIPRVTLPSYEFPHVASRVLWLYRTDDAKWFRYLTSATPGTHDLADAEGAAVSPRVTNDTALNIPRLTMPVPPEAKAAALYLGGTADLLILKRYAIDADGTVDVASAISPYAVRPLALNATNTGTFRAIISAGSGCPDLISETIFISGECTETHRYYGLCCHTECVTGFDVIRVSRPLNPIPPGGGCNDPSAQGMTGPVGPDIAVCIPTPDGPYPFSWPITIGGVGSKAGFWDRCFTMLADCGVPGVTNSMSAPSLYTRADYVSTSAAWPCECDNAKDHNKLPRTLFLSVSGDTTEWIGPMASAELEYSEEESYGPYAGMSNFVGPPEAGDASGEGLGSMSYWTRAPVMVWKKLVEDPGVDGTLYTVGNWCGIPFPDCSPSGIAYSRVALVQERIPFKSAIVRLVLLGDTGSSGGTGWRVGASVEYFWRSGGQPGPPEGLAIPPGHYLGGPPWCEPVCPCDPAPANAARDILPTTLRLGGLVTHGTGDIGADEEVGGFCSPINITKSYPLAYDPFSRVSPGVMTCGSYPRRVQFELTLTE